MPKEVEDTNANPNVDNTNEVSKGFKSSTFENKEDDPGFLVAKGKFHSKVLKEGQKPGESQSEFEDRVHDEQRQLEKAHVKSLASAIFMAMSNCGYATIRAVGRNASYNALKSIAIAKSYCAPKGVELCWDVSFDEGNLGALRNNKHVTTVTAMLFSVRGFREWSEETRKENPEDGN